MHVSLTDLVTCPRCGPTYGLVLMPEEVRDRRVVAGVMGCANCRERYRVEGGVADLRVPGASEPVAGRRAASPEGPSAEEGAGAGVAGGEEPGAESGAGDAVRLAALMGLAEASGTVLLLGPAAARGGEIAALVEGVEVVVAGSEVEGGGGGVGASVSRLRVSDRIPLRSGSMRGVVLSGREAWRLEEGARVVAPGGRLVVEPAPSDARERLEAAGLRVLAAEGGTVVAGR